MVDEDDVTNDSDYRELLLSTSEKIKINSMLFPTVGIQIVMNSEAGLRFAKDLRKISDEYQRDSS